MTANRIWVPFFIYPCRGLTSSDLRAASRRGNFYVQSFR